MIERLPTRAVNALKRVKVSTDTDLFARIDKMGIESIRKLNGIGPKTIAMIERTHKVVSSQEMKSSFNLKEIDYDQETTCCQGKCRDNTSEVKTTWDNVSDRDYTGSAIMSVVKGVAMGVLMFLFVLIILSLFK